MHPLIEVQTPPSSAHTAGLGFGAGATQHSAGPSSKWHPAGLVAATVPPCFTHSPSSMQSPPVWPQAAASGPLVPPLPVLPPVARPPWPAAPEVPPLPPEPFLPPVPLIPPVPLLPPPPLLPPAPPGMQQIPPIPGPQDKELVAPEQLPGAPVTQVPPACVQALTDTDVLPPTPLLPLVPPLPPEPFLPPVPLLPPAPPDMQHSVPTPEPQDKEEFTVPEQVPGATATHTPPASVQVLTGTDVLPPIPPLPLVPPLPPVPFLLPVPLLPPAPPGMQHSLPTIPGGRQDKEEFTMPEAQAPGYTATHEPPASVQALTDTDVLPPIPLLPPAPGLPPVPPPIPPLPPVPFLPPVPLLPPVPPGAPPALPASLPPLPRTLSFPQPTRRAKKAGKAKNRGDAFLVIKRNLVSGCVELVTGRTRAFQGQREIARAARRARTSVVFLERT